MKTRLLLLAVVAAGALAGAGGCADNRASIQVQAICFPTEDCVTEGGCDVVLTGVPSLAKPGVTTGNVRLVLLLQVENQLPDNADPERWRANTNDAHVDEVYVEYDVGVGSLAPAVSPTSSFIPAGTTAVVGIAIPVPAAAPEGEIVARVRLRGFLDDDSRFETGEFPIAFVFCTGCGTTCAAGLETCPQGASGQDPLVCIEETTPPAKPTP